MDGTGIVAPAVLTPLIQPMMACATQHSPERHGCRTDDAQAVAVDGSAASPVLVLLPGSAAARTAVCDVHQTLKEGCLLVWCEARNDQVKRLMTGCRLSMRASAAARQALSAEPLGGLGHARSMVIAWTRDTR